MRSTTQNRTIASTVTRAFVGIALAFALLIGGALMVHSAGAQEMWVERTDLIAKLAKSYAEAPVALGLTSDGAVVELFRTADGATWTLVATMPNGYSRIIATGEAWTNVPQTVKGRIS